MERNAPPGGIARHCAAIALFASILTAAPAVEAGKPACKSRGSRNDCANTPPLPPANRAPTISGTALSSIVAGQNYSFTPSASDADGNVLTFTIVNRPAWAAFSASTGRLSGTPTSSSVGEYIEIGIAVSDGQSQASLAPFAITVTQGNRAPTISGTAPGTAREGQAYSFAPVAGDADGDVLTFGITNRPAWASFNAATGALSGTPGTGSVGTYSGVTIRVSDGAATTSLPAFSIVVQQVAMGSATLSWQAPSTRLDGSPLTDLAGYRIRYGTAPDSFPNVVQIANAGVTTHVVENLPRGTYYFVATAYDTAGLESQFSGPVSKTID